MTLLHASNHNARGTWDHRQAADSVTLDFDARHRRRIRMITDRGEAILLDLASAVALADGDGLELDDGRWIKVKAADEAVLEVRHRDHQQLIRLAWHLGNRHLPTQIDDRVLRIRPDHVIQAMLEGLGADVVEVQAPFQPEGGAYSHRDDHGHGHHHGGHSHDHDHADGDHDHDHQHAHGHGHDAHHHDG